LDVKQVAGEAELRIIAAREPYEAPAGNPFVELVARTAGADAYAVAAFWTDAALIAAAGVPTVLYGPAGGGAHAAVEWVDLASLERVREVVLRVAAQWCA
jgi:acetylornithine deacetylase